MQLPPVAADVASIVVTGPMQPVVISPSLLREADLIGDAELEQSRIELLIPNEAIAFHAGWLRVYAQPQALEIQTSQEPEFERLRDLMMGLLRTMPEKPIAMMGMNRLTHFKIEDQARWHGVGDHLVNNKIWDGVLHLPGMRSVTYWATRTDGYGGRVHVQIEPSFQYPPGVFLSYNDHYDLTRVDRIPSDRDDEAFTRAENALAAAEKVPVATEILSENWIESMSARNAIVDRLFSQISQGSD